MGKLKRNRNNRKARTNPLGEKVVGKDESKDEKTRQSKIVPLINNLSSNIPNDKSMALGALTVICEDERMRKLCLKEKLVQKLMEQCLNDDNDEIVVEAFGLLRNLGIEEGYDVITYYWRQNIWASIEAGLGKIETSFKYLAEFKALPEGKKKVDEKAKAQLLYDFTENIISLIVVIASGSDELYDNVFAKIDPVLKLVVDLINWNSPTLRTTLKLHNTLLDFVYEFSTESSEFIQKLVQLPEFDSEKLTVQTSTNRLGKGYVEGIKYQVYESLGLQLGDKQTVIAEILTNLSNNITSINLDEFKTVFATDNAIEPIQKQEQPQSNEPLQNIDQQISGDSKEKTQAKDDIQLLETSLDIFTSIWEFLSINEADPQTPVSLSDDLSKILFKLCFPLFVELLQFDQANANVLQLTDKILVCFNNFCWLLLSCQNISTEWFELSLKLWDLVISVSTGAQSQNLYTQKNCLNVCWAVIKTVGPAIGDRLNQGMLTGLTEKCNELIQSSNGTGELELEFVLSCVGVVGSSAPLISDVEMTRNISQFLIQLVDSFSSKDYINGPASLEDKAKANEIVIQCLDLIYEIFGDAEYPYDYPVFVEGGYLSKLQKVEPQVKEMYKKVDKNKLGDLKARLEETWRNLNLFIQYKKSERN